MLAHRGHLIVPALLSALACGGGSSPTEPSRTVLVSFVYLEPSASDPRVDFTLCEGTGPFATHMHPGWAPDPPNTRLALSAVGSDRMEGRADVPVERDTYVQLHDPNSCLDGGSPYVPARNLFANGVLLGALPGSIDFDSMLFRVSASGTVTLVTR